MEAIIMILLIVLIGLYFLTWTEARSKSQPVDETDEKEAAKKPLTAESVRTALRDNGFSPEIVDTNLNDWQANGCFR